MVKVLFKSVIIVAFIAVGPFAEAASPGHDEPAAAGTNENVTVRNVDLADVRWTEGFWADRFMQAREVTLPTMWRYFQGETRSIGIDRDEASFVWDNFLIAAGRKQGRYRPVPGSRWGDGDFYKWLEAVAGVYLVTRDEDLDRLMDQVIEVIGEAQEDDGYLCTHVTLRKAKRFHEVRDHETDYPWDGDVEFSVLRSPSEPFSLMLRIPNWAVGAEVVVNGKALEADVPAGAYFPIRREWSRGDRVRLRLPMKVRLTEANPLVEELRNQVAVERGPIVYCLESHDLPNDTEVAEIVIPSNAQFDANFDMACRATVLKGRAYRRTRLDWDDELYRSAPSTPLQPIGIRMIPYYAWNNRGVCQMTVWMPVVWSVPQSDESKQ